MTIDWSKVLLLWDSKDPRAFGLDPSAFEEKRIKTQEIDYARIGRDPFLVSRIMDTGAEAVIFTSNDDMPGAPDLGGLLAAGRLGYTAVSAIDPDHQSVQTSECIQDLLEGRAEIDLPPPKLRFFPESADGSFSLIFDLEQLGGARFGMPRILPLLESAGIRATFFITGFIEQIYPDLIKRIVLGSHEIAVHGGMHEFMQGKSKDDQLFRITGEKARFEQYGKVTGANFIFRMDRTTPDVFAQCGLKYFVLFRKHVFYRTRFMPASCKPRRLRTSDGDSAMVPVSVETYGMSRQQIEDGISSAWKTAIKENVFHINLLLHPFKDGTLSRIDQTAWLISHLTGKLKLKPIPLNEIPEPEPVEKSAVHVFYRWDGMNIAESKASSGRLDWWRPAIYHSARSEKLCDKLNAAKKNAVLSTDEGVDNGILIYPDFRSDTRNIAADPLVPFTNPARKPAELLPSGGKTVIVPPPRSRDLLNFIIFHIPRTMKDCVLLLNKIIQKLKPS